MLRRNAYNAFFGTFSPQMRESEVRAAREDFRYQYVARISVDDAEYHCCCCCCQDQVESFVKYLGSVVLSRKWWKVLLREACERRHC